MTIIFYRCKQCNEKVKYFKGLGWRHITYSPYHDATPHPRLIDKAKKYMLESQRGSP